MGVEESPVKCPCDAFHRGLVPVHLERERKDGKVGKVVVGHIDRQQRPAVFITHRVSEYHFIHKYQGYGIQNSILERLVGDGVGTVEVHERRIDNWYAMRHSLAWWMKAPLHVLRARDGEQRVRRDLSLGAGALITGPNTRANIQNPPRIDSTEANQ